MGRFLFRLCISACGIASTLQLVAAQVPSSGAPTSTPASGDTARAAVRDPRAVSILVRSLDSAGNLTLIRSIKDYTANGTITYFFGTQESTGSLLIKARGTSQFLLEAQLPEGTKRYTVSHGKGKAIDVDGGTTVIPYHNAIKAEIPVLPQLYMSRALEEGTNTSYIGLDSTEGGRQNDKVRLEPHGLVGGPEDKIISKLLERNVAIDSTTHQISKIEQKIHPIQSFTRELDQEFFFSDYKLLNGNLLVPTTIEERISGSKIVRIHIEAVSINAGLSDADFSVE